MEWICRLNQQVVATARSKKTMIKARVIDLLFDLLGSIWMGGSLHKDLIRGIWKANIR